MYFFNRDVELSALSKLFELSKKHKQLIYIQGRRRIGKTELLREFCRNLNAFYFFTGRDTEAGFLDRFSTEVSRDTSFGPYIRFQSLDEAFEFIFSRLIPAKDAVIFDEFQNFAAIHPSSFGRFQMFWDRLPPESTGMLVACGSMQSLMHTIFEGLKEPLYKRATGRLVIGEFSPLSVHRLLSERFGSGGGRYFFDLYSVFGGVPFYYSLIDAAGLAGRPLTDILRVLAFDKSGVLYDEGSDIAMEAMGKSHAIFFSIMSAVAAGRNKYSEILSASGVAAGSLEKYLDQLVSTYGFLSRKNTVFSKKQTSRISRYEFADSFLSFWFRFVHRNRSMLEIGGGDRLVSSMNHELPSWQGHAWEKTVMNILAERNNAGAFEYPFTRIGPHFNQNGSADIDVVMINDDSRTCAAAECKLNLNTCNIPAVAEELTEKAARLPMKVKKKYLFSVEPITARTREYLSRHEGITAIDLDCLLGAEDAGDFT